MKLQRVICTQTDVEPHFEKVRQRVPFVSQEQGIVAQRTHGQSDLLQIEQILQCWNLAEEDSVRDGVGRQECRCKMVCVSCFTAVGSENESV